MTDELSPAEFAAELRRRARTEGAKIAYETALELCKNPETPAQARSAALNAILRMAGFFENVDDDGSGKEPHQMTADELQAEILRYRRMAKADPASGGQVFD